LLDALSDARTSLVGLFDFDLEGVAQWNGAIGSADLEPVTLTDRECQPRKRRGSAIWAALGPARKLKNQIGAKNAGIESRIR